MIHNTIAQQFSPVSFFFYKIILFNGITYGYILIILPIIILFNGITIGYITESMRSEII